MNSQRDHKFKRLYYTKEMILNVGFKESNIQIQNHKKIWFGEFNKYSFKPTMSSQTTRIFNLE